ncbi:hypothetical protein C8Q76DRAFT_663554 [Earliella scabrosa]|nr:hypothetical protein C8Q76DRAFT_663554 [Earliella scabrosa]
MGQYFYLLNVSLEQKGDLDGGLKWVEFFSQKQTFLVRSLTVPFPSAQVPVWLDGFTATRPLARDAGMLRLPNELLIKILMLCPAMLDKICLALTCKRMLSLAYDQIEEIKTARATPWVGGRLICIGDEVNYRSLPRTLLTDEEKWEVEGRFETGDEDDADEIGGLGFMLSEKTPLFQGNAELPYNRTLLTLLARCSGPDRERILELHDLHYPERDDWVVCNLTRTEYVRATAIAEVAKHPDDRAPFLPQCELDLGHVILYQICLSPENRGPGCYSFDYTGDLTQGEWIGHGFVITTMDRMPAPPEGKTWTDISEKVAEDLRLIWDSPLFA